MHNIIDLLYQCMFNFMLSENEAFKVVLIQDNYLGLR